MDYSKSRNNLLSLFFVIFMCYNNHILAQTTPEAGLYSNFNIGLSRAEDGLAFANTIDRKDQWTPTIGFGLGYKINKRISLEINATTMLGKLSATGTTENDTDFTIETSYSNVFVNPLINFPISARSDFFVRPGVGILFSKSTLSGSNSQNTNLRSSNIGFVLGIGYRFQIGSRIALNVQFDFSDPYGDSQAWEGDLGNLNLGFNYYFNKSK